MDFTVGQLQRVAEVLEGTGIDPDAAEEVLDRLRPGRPSERPKRLVTQGIIDIEHLALARVGTVEMIQDHMGEAVGQLFRACRPVAPRAFLRAVSFSLDWNQPFLPSVPHWQDAIQMRLVASVPPGMGRWTVPE